MEIQPNKVNIYGVKNGENFNYIGKTVRTASDEGKLKHSDVHYRYTNEKINNLFGDNTNITVIKVVDEEIWYNEKLHEVVEFYNKKHPLVNAQWMCEGKRGYWEGKVKDKYTIRRLSESKFKRVFQYDSRGKFYKSWRSGKAAATMVFKDYHVFKGSACSKLYGVLDASTLKGKFRHGYYWFKEEEIKRLYPKEIPMQIDLKNFEFNQQRKSRSVRKKTPIFDIRKASVKHYDIEGHIVYTYRNTAHAAYMLKTTMRTIQRICRGMIINKYYLLQYGEKSLQPVDETYPEYKVEPLRKNSY
jgi:hypothetical protein